MRKIGVYIIVFITSTSFFKDEEYTSYCNTRFNFCMKYPSSFKMRQQSENNDGSIFTSKDGKTEIWAYGRLAIEELDKLEQEFGFATDKIKITYRVMKSSWFVFSGVDTAGNTIYQKTVKKAVDYFGDPGTNVFQTIRISYPPSQQEKYKDYCDIIAKSL